MPGSVCFESSRLTQRSGVAYPEFDLELSRARHLVSGEHHIRISTQLPVIIPKQRNASLIRTITEAESSNGEDEHYISRRLPRVWSSLWVVNLPTQAMLVSCTYITIIHDIRCTEAVMLFHGVRKKGEECKIDEGGRWRHFWATKSWKRFGAFMTLLLLLFTLGDVPSSLLMLFLLPFLPQSDRWRSRYIYSKA